MAKSLGVIGVFKTEGEILKAAKAAQLKKYKKYDAYTPYPVHGLDDAMAIKRSWLPYVTFAAGLTGTLTALALQIYTSAFDWPLNVGGKPFISLPAFIPITFELTVLFGGLATVGAMFYAMGLPKVDPPILHPEITKDKFILFVPVEEPGYNESEVMGFLKGLHPDDVQVVKTESK